MPYNPGITYNPSPIFEGSVMGSNAVAQGMQHLALGIGSGIQGYSAAQDKEKEKQKLTNEELDFLTGMAQNLRSQNALTDEDILKFNTGGIGAKRALVSSGGAKLHQVYKVELEKMQQRAAPAPFALDPSQIKDLGEVDPQLKGVFSVPTSRGGVQIVDRRKLAQPALEPGDNRFEEVVLPSGVTVTVDKYTGKPHYTSPRQDKPQIPILSEEDKANARILALDKEIAAAQSEVDKGNKRWGWDKIPLGETYEDKVKRLKGEKASIQEFLSRSDSKAKPAAATARTAAPEAAKPKEEPALDPIARQIAEAEMWLKDPKNQRDARAERVREHLRKLKQSRP